MWKQSGYRTTSADRQGDAKLNQEIDRSNAYLGYLEEIL